MLRTVRPVLVTTLLLVTSLAVTARHPVPAHAEAEPLPIHLVSSEHIATADQVVIVHAPSTRSTSATVTMWERKAGAWGIAAGPFDTRLGRNGLSPAHVEGDGTTPIGSFRIVSAFGLAKRARTALPYTQLVEDSCWISDSARADYNRMVSLGNCRLPNEHLFRIAEAGPYERAIVTSYNMWPIVPKVGSAIFIHSHSYDSRGRTKTTSGCVSLSDTDLAALWTRLDPARQPRVVIGTTGWLVG